LRMMWVDHLGRGKAWRDRCGVLPPPQHERGKHTANPDGSGLSLWQLAR
jgi:hypothetical protein